jgi:alpha-tubulin suppressor-like RCC1 family protein
VSSATPTLYPDLVQNSTGPGAWSDWNYVTSSYANDYFTCGLRENGTAWCWGNELYGKLGNNVNNSSEKTRPSQVRDSSGAGVWTDWISVSSGYRTSCGLRINGTAWCWGLSSSLGDGDPTAHSAQNPVQVQTNTGPGSWTNWKKVATGYGVACGLLTDGTAWCWGEAYEGVLGDDQTAVNRERPVQVKDSAGTSTWSDWIDISVGRSQACGMRKDHTVWCWGTNAHGGLGNGTQTNSAKPVQVQDNVGPTAWNDWVQISVGYLGACGIRTNGQLWCWGTGFDGANGDNSASYRLNPVLVQTDTGPGGWNDWVYVNRGSGMTCGIRRNGTLWCWGTGYFGNGTGWSTIRRPVKVVVP